MIYQTGNIEAPLQVLDSLIHRIRHRAYFEPSFNLFEKRKDSENNKESVELSVKADLVIIGVGVSNSFDLRQITNLKEFCERETVSLDDICANS